MFRSLSDLAGEARYDIVVIGAGGAGLSAALFAAIEGQRVLLVEHTEVVGGTTAFSAGTTWIPGTQHAASVNPDDTQEKVLRFLDAVVGNRAPAELRRAFLESGPQAVATLARHSDVIYRPYATHPDYVQEAEGATLRGRALEPVPFDGRLLGGDLARIRRPIPEFTLFGGMMVDRTDIGHLLKMGKSWQSARHAARILGRYALDRRKGSRGTRLLMGNALVGRLLYSLLKRDVDIVLSTSVTAIEPTAEAAWVTLQSGDTSRRIGATRALISSAGGFNRNPARRAALLHAPVPELSPSAPGHTGAMQDLLIGLGARLGEGALDNAYWAPVSTRRRADGTTAVFPHFVLDRSKPGTVCVDQKGRRFVNEATSYHLFARAMFEAHKTTPTIPCFIVADGVALRKYGLGMVRPGGRGLAAFLADGYLAEAATPEALAVRLGIDAAGLADTIARMNRFAASGRDDDFGRGTTAYHHVNGDPAHTPNPNLGAIATPPFYAVRLVPGDIGAATGLVTDTFARVLDAAGRPLPRLYACGNEMQSIMGGTYPGPGITLGPGLVFAYRAVQSAVHGAGVPR